MTSRYVNELTAHICTRLWGYAPNDQREKIVNFQAHAHKVHFHFRFYEGLCPSFLSITSAWHTDIGEMLLVGIMLVLSVKLLLPDCLRCIAAISQKPRHIVTEPLYLFSHTIDLLWGILYPFPGGQQLV